MGSQDAAQTISQQQAAGGMSGDALMRYEALKKSEGVAMALVLLFGMVGAHRFYMGKVGSGAAMLVIFLLSLPLSLVIVGWLTLLGLFVWNVVDVFAVLGWVRSHNADLLARVRAAT